MPGCSDPHLARGLCNRHYHRLRAHGDPAKALKPKKRGDETVLGTDGYLRRRGNAKVHRLVAAQKIGRALRQGEVVHHIDGDKRNNDPANLEVFASQAEHMRHHRRETCGKGHANWRIEKNGSRSCRTCDNERAKRRRGKR